MAKINDALISTKYLHKIEFIDFTNGFNLYYTAFELCDRSTPFADISDLKNYLYTKSSDAYIYFNLQFVNGFAYNSGTHYDGIDLSFERNSYKFLFPAYTGNTRTILSESSFSLTITDSVTPIHAS